MIYRVERSDAATPDRWSMIADRVRTLTLAGELATTWRAMRPTHDVRIIAVGRYGQSVISSTRA